MRFKVFYFESAERRINNKISEHNLLDLYTLEMLIPNFYAENYVVWFVLGRINNKDKFLKVARNNESCHV